jgi:hypothetical protein
MIGFTRSREAAKKSKGISRRGAEAQRGSARPKACFPLDATACRSVQFGERLRRKPCLFAPLRLCANQFPSFLRGFAASRETGKERQNGLA